MFRTPLFAKPRQQHSFLYIQSSGALDSSDFIKGSLNKPSNIRPNRLFTAEKSIITRKIGTVNPEVFEKVTDKLFEIIKY